MHSLFHTLNVEENNIVDVMNAVRMPINFNVKCWFEDLHFCLHLLQLMFCFRRWANATANVMVYSICYTVFTEIA